MKKPIQKPAAVIVINRWRDLSPKQLEVIGYATDRAALQLILHCKTAREFRKLEKMNPRISSRITLIHTEGA